MAVIKRNTIQDGGSTGSALQALTAAALVLPGLGMTAAYAADGDEVDFQYGHYQEGRREIYGTVLDSGTGYSNKVSLPKKSGIDVDSLHGSARLTLSDRVKFAFNYTQDTWSGATPVATAPVGFGGNRPIGNSSGDAITGASPIIQSLTPYFDTNLKPLRLNKDWLYTPSFISEFISDKQLVHTLATASPETRKQGDFKLSYEWDEAAVDAGGGISVENDYESRFVNLGGRWDLNRKLTSLNLGLSYTNSHTKALLDHDAAPYIDQIAYSDQISIDQETGGRTLRANRQDWATNFGVTQVLSKSALIHSGVGYTRSTGYMANPYKVVEAFFVDPDQLSDPTRDFFLPNNVLTAEARAFMEQRPDVRSQWTWDLGYVQHIAWVDAALHFNYRFFHDDWGIDAHTFEGDWVQPIGAGWTVTPRVRYYSQDAADFYHPYLVTPNKLIRGGQGQPTAENFNNLPKHFSSDHRLSGYGALSGGVVISKQFARGVSLEAGFEYYTHAGDLKLGKGGESDFADFNYYVVNGALKVNLSALGGADTHEGHHDHSEPHAHQGSHAPAGVMFDHMIGRAGDFMVGYRYMYSRQAGNMLHGSNKVDDQVVVNKGCAGYQNGCLFRPAYMDMHMHMLDLMYAPTDWLNLMLMPQFVDMEMRLSGELRPLSSAEDQQGLGGHAKHIHTTGGVGDTGMYALVKLYKHSGHEAHFALGLSAPTGDVGIKLRPMHANDAGYIHYGMQLGSGTWDFKPSLTYTGHMGDWSWGAQLSGTKRLENQNESGFAFGDIFQSTAWGGYNLLDWLTASVRGVYTVQGEVKNQFNPVIGRKSVDDGAGNIVTRYVNVNPQYGSMDYPGNYGGRYWDVGFGISAIVPEGSFKGNRLSVEWLHPVEDDVNGYQLERKGALAATWSLAF